MKLHTKALFRIKNFGSLPATNVRTEYYVKIVENGTESNLKTSELDGFPDGKTEAPLAPQESYGVDIPMSKVFISTPCYPLIPVILD
ncbi:MAG: hypothetical protein KGH89_06130 [Thaumarchaeota archaeon]|nr:hypothetical protein [Nitrososphaerota archaeon]